MNCNVIMDLLPLYVDDALSDESRKLVEEHIEVCEACRNIAEAMNSEITIQPVEVSGEAMRKVQLFKGSLLQSILMFMSFALIVFGVFLEASTPLEDKNGFWAFAVIIPVTGFFLSLANMYFIRVYKSKKAFSFMSMLFTLICVVGCFIWGFFHYGAGALSVNSGYILGLSLSVALTVCSYLFAKLYAKFVGKD